MIQTVINRARRLPWLLSGVLLFACYPPVACHALVVVALAPMLWMVRHRNPRFCFKWCYLSGLLYWVATLRWMSALKDTGGPAALVLLGWIALAAYCAVYFGLFGWLAAHVWGWTQGRSMGWRLAAVLVAEPVLWGGLELVRSRLGTGFAWNHLGTVPVVMGLGASAAFGGVYLTGMLTVLVNGSFVSFFDRIVAGFRESRGGTPSPIPRWFRSLETQLPFALVVAVHLAARYSISTHIVSGDQVSVGLCQRNFPPPFADARKRLGDDGMPYEVYMEMAKALQRLKPSLLVLSESAMSEFAPSVEDPRAALFAGRLMEASGAAAVISGGSRGSFAGPLYNSAALYTRDEPIQVYDKVHLVPFGEYIPGDKLIPALQALAPVGSCTPGEVKTLEFPLASSIAGIPDQKVPVGIGICFEDTDSALMRRFAEMGARMLVFITNDSWFYGSDEPEQHAWQAVARAIETGLPVVRVGNYGVTGVVDPHGGDARQCRTGWLKDAAGRLQINGRERMAADVTLACSVPEVAATAYVRYGDKPLLTAFLLLILAMGVIKYLHDYEKRRQLSM